MKEADREKSVAQKGRRISADLRDQIAVGYSVRCNPVDSMSTGGRFSNVARYAMTLA